MSINLKRFIAMMLMVAVLVGCATCFAASAGGSADPLVSLSYLTSTFKSLLVTDAENKTTSTIGTLLDGYSKRLDALKGSDGGHSGYSFANGFTSASIDEGAYLKLDEFACFVPVSGVAVLKIDKGEVINISTGESVESGTALTQYNKYFAAEDTTASVRSYSTTLSGLVDGYYTSAAAETFADNEMFYDIFGHWSEDYINELYGYGIVDGTEAHRFMPDGKVTRGMLVTILGRIKKINSSNYKNTGFTDVVSSDWYGPYVAWAREAGISDGYDDGSFHPNDYVTREQMALMITRFAVYMNVNIPLTEQGNFSDYSEIDSWAVAAVEYAQRTGLLNGRDENRFEPLGTATRAEVCTVASRFIKLSGLQL